MEPENRAPLEKESHFQAPFFGGRPASVNTFGVASSWIWGKEGNGVWGGFQAYNEVSLEER